MSQYFFAVHDGQFGGKLPGGSRTAKRRDRIAKQIDPKAGYVYYYSEGERRYYGHGYCPNLGAPFDGDTSRAIEAAWDKAGVS